MQKKFWEIWVEVYAWLNVRWTPHLPRRPLTFTKGSDVFELGPKNDFYLERKNIKSQIFLVLKVYLVKFRYREDHEINGVV